MTTLKVTEQIRRVLLPVLGIAVAAFVVLVLSAGAASAQAQLIEICHKGQTIKVDVHAVPAHLEHGDRLGNCDGGACAPCALIFDPVTCPNGKVYANSCFAECDGQTSGCVRLGICSNIWDPVTCNGVTYANACQAANAGATNCAAACACPQIYAPVRCADGRIYVNACVAQCQGATGCTPL
jgi:hypothetical protein